MRTVKIVSSGKRLDVSDEERGFAAPSSMSERGASAPEMQGTRIDMMESGHEVLDLGEFSQGDLVYIELTKSHRWFLCELL